MVWQLACSADDIPLNSGHEVVVGNQIVAIFNVDGKLYAMDGICPHQGGPLGKGALQGCIITCPWHGFQFDVTTGVHQATPNLRHPTIPVKVEDDQVFVELE